MAKKSLLVLLLFVLIVIPLTSSAITQCSDFGTGVVLKDQPLTLISENYNFTVQPFNSSNGALLKPATTFCAFYLYDFNGNHQFTQLNLSYDYTNYNYYLNILSGNFTKVGHYPYTVVCARNDVTLTGTCSGNFEVLGARLILSTAHGIIYFIKFIILFLLIGASLFSASKLPSGNNTNENGQIISINNLKYLRGTLYFVSWVLFLSVFFLISNLSFAYLGEELFAKTSFLIWNIGMKLTPLIVIVWFIWIFAQIIDDKRMRRLIEHGIYEGKGGNW